ncbi:long-chain-fatty-acid--CoA ligase [Tsukamurella tyrosinosolvens]|uniref:long-chain-fatty-acid--CoA ligase n=1 Tax=Tsukamurella tyrosinosolvens TaxID=57704 RepID=UPI000DF71A80|nr:long-chain-fatty-acid--CoA ligase [Tsukamurella tyrosinosolvens]RDB48570.1 fatty acid--CoA ligase [Tsukamurella tyrosinosolvens]
MLTTMSPTPLSLASILVRGATMHAGARVSTRRADGTVEQTGFAEIGDGAARLAHALSELGVEIGDRVATLLWNDRAHLEAYLAIPAMGAVLHPLNVRLSPRQLRDILRDAEDRVLIVGADLLPLVRGAVEEVSTLEHLVVVGDEDAGPATIPGVRTHRHAALVAGRSAAFPWPTIDENSPAALCYTSGTTGNPKGVVYSHRSMWLHTMQVCMTDGPALREGDRVLVIVPQFHAMAWGLPHAAFMIGASLILPGPRPRPEHLLDLIASERPTYAAAVPTVWHDILQLDDANESTVSPLRTLRDVQVGGSATSAATVERFRTRGVNVLQGWGMTETSPLVSMSRPPADSPDDVTVQYATTQGRLFGAVQARLIGDDGAVVPHDGVSVGEIELRGPWVTSAYHRGVDPEAFHDGWLRTGDIGSVDPAGYVRVSDRKKDMIKSGGEWISSIRLETEVAADPTIAEVAVIAVADERWGERPLAVVVPRHNATIDFARIRDGVARRLARWETPNLWAQIDALPRTGVGKIDKRSLRERHGAGAIVVHEVG